jgi:hypothetical protein
VEVSRHALEAYAYRLKGHVHYRIWAEQIGEELAIMFSILAYFAEPMYFSN